MAQWLDSHAFTAEGTGLIPGQETKILQATWWSQKKKKNVDLPSISSPEAPQSVNESKAQSC